MGARASDGESAYDAEDTLNASSVRLQRIYGHQRKFQSPFCFTAQGTERGLSSKFLIDRSQGIECERSIQIIRWTFFVYFLTRCERKNVLTIGFPSQKKISRCCGQFPAYLRCGWSSHGSQYMRASLFRRWFDWIAFYRS